MGDYQTTEDKLKEKVVIGSKIWNHDKSLCEKWVLFEDAKQAIREARREVEEIDEDCIQWNLQKRDALMKELKEFYEILKGKAHVSQLNHSRWNTPLTSLLKEFNNRFQFSITEKESEK